MLTGMAFTLFNGRATWDYAGKAPATVGPSYTISGNVTVSGTPLNGVGFSGGAGTTCVPSDASGQYSCTVPQGYTGSIAPMLSGYIFTPASRNYSNVNANQNAQNYTAAVNADTVWFDDAPPAGAIAGGDGNWVNNNPLPFSGNIANQSSSAAGLHQYYFQNASTTLSVGVGEKLFAYVYLDPANPPSQVMLQWNDVNWEHRAYWGSNSIAWGVEGTVSRRFMGPLPPLGQWVRLEVPASLVGLEGRVLTGMAFTLFNGRATWDYAGKR